MRKPRTDRVLVPVVTIDIDATHRRRGVNVDAIHELVQADIRQRYAEKAKV